MVRITKQEFKEMFNSKIYSIYAHSINEATNEQLQIVLSSVIKDIIAKYWVDNKNAWEKFKKDVNSKLKSNNTQGSTSVKFKNGDYTGKKARVTANVLNVRYDRGTNYKVIAKLKKGNIVKLNYCLNGWISIEGYKGNKGLGYVSTDYLEII